jgi:hypothetical protein
VVYELRRWFNDADCLYTDDRRVKDLALRSPDLRVIATYFRTPAESRPFAWDIVGAREELASLARSFQRSASTHRR